MKNSRLLGPVAALALGTGLVLSGCSDTTVDEQGESVAEESVGESSDGAETSADETTADETTSDETTPEDSDSADSDDSEGPTPRDQDLIGYDFPVSQDEAIETSDGETGGGTIYSIEIDWSDDNEGWLWEIETWADNVEWEVKINADTGEVVKTDQDSEDNPDEDDTKEIFVDGILSPAEAMEAARGALPGTVSGWKLEWDHGTLAYEVDIRSDSDDDEVIVDANTGETRLDH